MPRSSDHIKIPAKSASGGQVTFTLSYELIDRVRKYHATTFFNMLSINEVLENPTAIFKGLCRYNFENGICYAGKPSKLFHDATTTVPFPSDKVFLVFIDDQGRIFKWRLELESDSKVGCPVEYETRFSDVLWMN